MRKIFIVFTVSILSVFLSVESYAQEKGGANADYTRSEAGNTAANMQSVSELASDKATSKKESDNVGSSSYSCFADGQNQSITACSCPTGQTSYEHTTADDSYCCTCCDSTLVGGCGTGSQGECKCWCNPVVCFGDDC